MTMYRIESKAGVVYGDYWGETKEEAFAQMCHEAGAAMCSEGPGSAADWLIYESPNQERQA